MTDNGLVFLPEVNSASASSVPAPAVKGTAPCPCCGYITIPNDGDAVAYICPVCFWEIDIAPLGSQQPSDQNHGLTLEQARQNYLTHGAVLPRLKKHCRKPLAEEIPVGDAPK